MAKQSGFFSQAQQDQNDAFIQAVNDEFSPHSFAFGSTPWTKPDGLDSDSHDLYYYQSLSAAITPTETTLYCTSSEKSGVIKLKCDWVKLLVSAAYHDPPRGGGTLCDYRYDVWIMARLAVDDGTVFSKMTTLMLLAGANYDTRWLDETLTEIETGRPGILAGTCGDPSGSTKVPNPKSHAAAYDSAGSTHFTDAILIDGLIEVVVVGQENPSWVVLETSTDPVIVPACP